MIMRFERETLLRGIELLRENDTLDAETILELICIKETEGKRKGRSRNISSRNYNQSEKELFRNIMKMHKEVTRVPKEVIRETGKKVGRTDSAVVAQLYKAEKEVGGNENE